MLSYHLISNATKSIAYMVEIKFKDIKTLEFNY